jgi:hypothetical protein
MIVRYHGTRTSVTGPRTFPAGTTHTVDVRLPVTLITWVVVDGVGTCTGAGCTRATGTGAVGGGKMLFHGISQMAIAMTNRTLSVTVVHLRCCVSLSQVIPSLNPCC